MMPPNWRTPLETWVFPSVILGEDSEDDSHEGLLQTVNNPGPRENSAARRNLFCFFSILASICALGGVLFVVRRVFPPSPLRERPVFHNNKAVIALDQVFSGKWNEDETMHSETWIAGPNGEDGHLLRKDYTGETAFLWVDDLRSCDKGDWGVESSCITRHLLLNSSTLIINGEKVSVHEVWPSPDLQKLLIMSDLRKQWRHSKAGRYWIMDVATQEIGNLDPTNDEASVQWASWSPTSENVLFARQNNLFLRQVSSDWVTILTENGGEDLYYGVPDWVYEEEILQTDRAAWWSPDGQRIVFLRLNDSQVPDYSLKYYFSHVLSGNGEHSSSPAASPAAEKFKFPIAGGSIPIADLQFYNIATHSMISWESADDQERVILEVMWVSQNSIITRETDRTFDIEIFNLVNIQERTCDTLRVENMTALDGGWVEVEPSETMVFVPSDPRNNRPYDGYISLRIDGGYRHLAYYTPLRNPIPIMLTSGPWEVANTPVIDLTTNMVYFTANKRSSVEMHIYEVGLHGGEMSTALSNAEQEGYYSASFSSKAGYFILSYAGPLIPWRKIHNTRSSHELGVQYEEVLETNQQLAEMVAAHELPTLVYGTLEVDGFTLQTLERRPPSFDPSKKYPVLFAPYGGPNSQWVAKKFTIGFEAYLASTLGYIVVSVDGRGTGFAGRMLRCAVRDSLGYWEAHDQIAAGKLWAKKSYVNEARMAIWGWSYGAFLTLKTLEQDAGRTFQYGIAVAPITDWRLYDFAYAERHMHTPQQNPDGYAEAAVSNMSALNQTSRFLLVHGTADDNVHFLNSLALVDKLNQATVENYDMLYFPDSNHGLFFHNAHTVVFDRLTNWLINAFNGEWDTIRAAVPNPL